MPLPLNSERKVKYFNLYSKNTQQNWIPALYLPPLPILSWDKHTKHDFVAYILAALHKIPAKRTQTITLYNTA